MDALKRVRWGRQVIFVAVAVAAIIALAVFAVPALSAPKLVTASGQGAYYFDNARYNGARAGLSFQANDLASRGRVLRDVDGVVQLPSRWANGFCARAVVYINGMAADAQGRQCDTNGDALLAWQFRDLELQSGDVATLWISDPVTRYRVSHPSIRVR